VTGFLVGLVAFAVVYLLLGCLAFFLTLIGRTMTGLIVAAVAGSAAFLLPVAYYNWPELPALALGVVSALVMGRLAYYAMSTPEQRRQIVYEIIRR
jgi:hypothetical protein